MQAKPIYYHADKKLLPVRLERLKGPAYLFGQFGYRASSSLSNTVLRGIGEGEESYKRRVLQRDTLHALLCQEWKSFHVRQAEYLAYLLPERALAHRYAAYQYRKEYERMTASLQGEAAA